MPVKAKLAAAADATDAVQDLVGEALELLQSQFNGRIANGYGIYGDPSSKRYALRQAVKHLNEAAQRMEATAWPSSADYDAVE